MMNLKNQGYLAFRKRPAAVPTVDRAIEKTRALLEKGPAGSDEAAIHSAKSVLYVAIEQTRTLADDLHVLHRMLREMMVIVTQGVALRDYERRAGLEILRDLEDRYLKSSSTSSESEKEVKRDAGIFTDISVDRSNQP